jgi:NAD(P)-dependent dehydrogenase (short-subunit alcohol dehydrogenase family)
MQLESRRIALVGGANGCGAAAVRAFVREGANVATFDVLDADGESVAAAANERGPGKATFFHIDISDRASVKEAFAAAAGALAGLDSLVLTAAISKHVPPEEYTDAQWQQLVDINLTGTFLTNQEIFPYLVANGGGRIINFASGAGIRQYPDGAAYAATKGGVIAWSRSLAYAWGKHNITVNCVNPGIAGGLMTAKAFEDKGISPEQAVEGYKAMGPAFEAMFPLGKRRFPPRPEDKDLPEFYGGDADADLGPVLVFLVGEGSRFITAQMIAVDGGMDPLR